MTPKGNPVRLDTHIDIPLEIIPPYFEDGGDLRGSHKLVLQAVVCHRGNSIHSGHYVALVRMAGSQRTDNRSGSTSSPQCDIWVRFDDLANERITATNIEKALVEESPYLLFYRIQPVFEEEQEEHPPAYEEPSESLASLDEKLRSVSASGRTSFEVVDWASRRTSIDHGTLDGQLPRSSMSDGRRTSVQFTTPSLVLEQSPTEPVTPLSDSSNNGFMVSRQPTNRSSKPGSQGLADYGGKRFNLSMSKIASRLSGDKASNPEIIVNDAQEDAPVSVATTDDALSSSPEEQRVKMKATEKEKKKKTFKTMSRRGSGDKLRKGKDGDRDCIVM